MSDNPTGIQILSTNMLHQRTPTSLFGLGEEGKPKAAKEAPPLSRQEEIREQEEMEKVDEKERKEFVDDGSPKFPTVYQDNFYLYNVILLILTMIGTVVYIGQLMATRVLSALIYHRYPRFDQKPGAFVDDRITYFAIILAIASARLPIFFCTIWMLRPITMSIKRIICIVFIILFIVVDVLVLSSWGIAWGFLCNKSIYDAYAPCNALPDDICSVYGATFTDRCMPPFVVPPPGGLAPMWAFYLLFACVGFLLIMEIALLVITLFLQDEASEYKRLLIFKRSNKSSEDQPEDVPKQQQQTKGNDA